MLHTQTCDGLQNGLASKRKFNAGSNKAISLKSSAYTHPRTKETNTEARLATNHSFFLRDKRDVIAQRMLCTLHEGTRTQFLA